MRFLIYFFLPDSLLLEAIMKLCPIGLQRFKSGRPIRLFLDIHTARARQWSLTPRCYSSVSAAELQFGQPLHETHPHLLKAGERKSELDILLSSEK